MDFTLYQLATKNQKTLMTDPTILTIINRYKTKLIRAGIPVEQVILFGSQVQGKAHKWSDIDTCVISPLFGHDRQAERLKLMKLTDKETERIEPHPYSPQDFANRFDPLANEIRKTGISI